MDQEVDHTKSFSENNPNKESVHLDIMANSMAKIDKALITFNIFATKLEMTWSHLGLKWNTFEEIFTKKRSNGKYGLII